MALNVGELEATLKLKSSLEKDLEAANKTLAGFGVEVRKAGTTANDSAKQFDLLGGMAARLTGLFTVGAIISFGREILKAGDDIQKMSDKTGIGTQEIQKLQYIAGQTGTGVEALVGAAQNLQQRLGSGDEGTVGALRRLGLNADAFNKLDTYRQMTLLGESVRAIKDPTEQARTASELFGKSWKEMMPALKSGMKELGDQAPVMADSVVKSLDRIGDTMTAARQQSIAWGGSFVLAIEGAGFAVGDFLSKFNPEHFGVANSEILQLAGALNDPDGLKGALVSVKKPTLDVSEAAHALTISAEETKRVIDDLDLSMSKATHARELAADLKKAHEQVILVEQGVRGGLSPALLDLGTHVDMAAQGKLYADLMNVEHAAFITKEGLQGLASNWEAVGEHTTVAIDAAKGLEFVGPLVETVGEAAERTRIKFVDFKPDLGSLAQHFVALGQIGGDAMGAIAKTAGMAFENTNMIQKSFESGDFIGGFVGMIGLAQQLGEAWDEAFGSMTEGLEEATDAWEQHAHDVTQQVTGLTDVTKTQMEALDAEAAKLKELGYSQAFANQAAAALMLNDIIEQQGGLAHMTAEELKVVTVHAQTLFGVVAVGGEEGAEATELLNQLIVGLGTDALDANGFVSELFLGLVSQAKAAGVEVDGLDKLMKGWGTQAVESVNAITEGVDGSTESLRDLGIQALASFDGTDASMRALHPTLAALRAGYAAIGESTDDAALQALLMQDTIVSGNPKVVAALDALVGENAALFNLGRLNEETFGAMERTGYRMYAQLQSSAAAAGGATEDALAPMQPWLQSAAEAATRLGIPLDANTQMLIDQSKDLGLWKDAGKSANDVLLGGMEALVGSVKELVDQLKGTIGNTETLGADSVQHMRNLQGSIAENRDRAREFQHNIGGVIGEIASIPTDISAPWDRWDNPPSPPDYNIPKVDAPWQDWGPPPSFDESMGMAAGGVVPAYAAGGLFVPRGTDTVPAMLTPGERVLTVSQNRAFEQGRLGGAASNADILAELRRLNASLLLLPETMATASRDAVLLASA